MPYIKRAAEDTVLWVSKMFPVLLVTGPRQVASPGKAAIKNFHVLDSVSTPKTASGTTDTIVENLKVEIGTGSVVCMANDLLPINEKNWCVPVWLI